MESDIRYYRRRACEEMSAATRAVTEEARERRLQLVDHYVRKLEELKAPSPFDWSDRNQVSHRAVRDSRLHEIA